MTKATDAMRARNFKHGHSLKGMQSKEYRAYWAMLSRCYNATNKEYHNYGGRGICVCRWWVGDNGFSNFLADMGFAPSTTHTMDRIDTNGDYTPANCRWATPKEQMENRRNTVKYMGRPMTRWAEIYNLNYHTLMCRWRVGDRGPHLFRIVEPRHREADHD